MDIRNVGNHGAVERGDNRPQRAQQKREGAGAPVIRDEATISESTRATANAVEGMAEKAKQGDGDREAIVANAMQRLMSGELDDESVYRATAKALHDSRFLGA